MKHVRDDEAEMHAQAIMDGILGYAEKLDICPNCLLGNVLVSCVGTLFANAEDVDGTEERLRRLVDSVLRDVRVAVHENEKRDGATVH